MKVVALAGGVGGAKLADGLARVLPFNDLTVIVNTGDDFNHFGLRICPDLDTVCYTLAGLANPSTGWGLENESWNVFQKVIGLGGPDWFHLGDNDLATHLERTRRLASGESLSQVVQSFSRCWNIQQRVLPMTDDPVATIVQTDDYGDLPFQEYFVKLACKPKVCGFTFNGIETAQPAPGVLKAIQECQVVIFCPSNPWVSISPILMLPGIKKTLAEKIVIAISPIIEGKTIKGPAAKMYQELGITPSASAVAAHYQDVLTGFIADDKDKLEVSEITGRGIIVLTTNIFMSSLDDRKRLAGEVLQFYKQIRR
jgi:LPPG:FO 2-phospho-L-lactate transferase